MITEADEPLIGKDPEEAKRLALENLRQQWLNDETRGVIQMYEDAARAVGAIQDEIDAVRPRPRRKVQRCVKCQALLAPCEEMKKMGRG